MAVSEYVNIDPVVVGVAAFSDTQAPRVVNTASYAPHAIGGMVWARHSTAGYRALFQYAQGSNVASAGQFVRIQNGSAVVANTSDFTNFLPVGVACAAMNDASRYGWVLIEGYCDFAKGPASSLAANQAIFPTVYAPVSYTSSQSNSLTVMIGQPVFMAPY